MSELIIGSEAMVRAALASGCKFYAAYPMTPATKLLEAFSRDLPGVGGCCMLAETELEAVNMAWGAAATGRRSAVGGCGQGLALMQESFSEITVAGVPIVIFNMARGQGDYFQSTRGGGHGDYRHIVLAPKDVEESVQLTLLAFELSDHWRVPVLVHADYFVAHGAETVDLSFGNLQPAPEKPWAVDGRMSGTGRSMVVSSLSSTKYREGLAGTDAADIVGLTKRLLEKLKQIKETETRCEIEYEEGAEVIVAAWGAAAKFVQNAIDELHDSGVPVGFFRPITLYPYPTKELKRLAKGKRGVLVFETNSGQMYEDALMAVLGECPVKFIGEYSTDNSTFGIAPILNTESIKQQILNAMETLDQ